MIGFFVVFIALTLWITGQVIKHFFGRAILTKIELLEAEWQLHIIRRNRIIKRNRASYNVSKVPHIDIQEVSPLEAERLRSKFKKKRATSKKITPINLN